MLYKQTAQFHNTSINCLKLLNRYILFYIQIMILSLPVEDSVTWKLFLGLCQANSCDVGSFRPHRDAVADEPSAFVSSTETDIPTVRTNFR